MAFFVWNDFFTLSIFSYLIDMISNFFKLVTYSLIEMLQQIYVVKRSPRNQLSDPAPLRASIVSRQSVCGSQVWQWQGTIAVYCWKQVKQYCISHKNAFLWLFLLAKIYNFWQVCSFVGLSVCLSVSLSVLSSITHERVDISSPNLVHIWNGWAVPVCDIDK